jgi:hypothetical protein
MRKTLKIDIRNTDVRWSRTHDRCSRCHAKIADDYVPLILFPKDRRWMLVYHWPCVGYSADDEYDALIYDDLESETPL